MAGKDCEPVHEAVRFSMVGDARSHQDSRTASPRTEQILAERPQRTPTTNGQRNGSHRNVVRGFPEIDAVMRAKAVSEPVESASHGLDIGLRGLTAILWLRISLAHVSGVC